MSVLFRPPSKQPLLRWHSWLPNSSLLELITVELSVHALKQKILRVFEDHKTESGRISFDVAYKWLLTQTSSEEAYSVVSGVFPLLCRDQRPCLSDYEFVLAIFATTLSTIYVRPPTPALYRAWRQLAFIHFDHDADGLLNKHEWNSAVEALHSFPEFRPPVPDAKPFRTCIRGIEVCLSQQLDSEIRIAGNEEAGLWADSYWNEKQQVINYDSFYEAIERKVFPEPRLVFAPILAKALGIEVGPTKAQEFRNAFDKTVQILKPVAGMIRSSIPFIASQMSNLLTDHVLAHTEDEATTRDQVESVQCSNTASIETEPASDASKVSENTHHVGTDFNELEFPQPPSPLDPLTSEVSDKSSSGEPSPGSEGLQDTQIPSRAHQFSHNDLDGSPIVTEQTLASWISDMYMAYVVPFLEEKETQSILASDDWLRLAEISGMVMGRKKLVINLVPKENQKICLIGELNGDPGKIRSMWRKVLTGTLRYSIPTLEPATTLVFTGNWLWPRATEFQDQELLLGLATIWLVQAMFSDKVYFVRGKNEAMPNERLKTVFERAYGATVGTKLWNVVLDSWEFSALGITIPELGVIYGGSFTESIEEGFERLAGFPVPFRIPVTIEGDEFTSPKLLSAVQASYKEGHQSSICSAAIKTRTRRRTKWVCQNQSLVITNEPSRWKWFDLVYMTHHDEYGWTLSLHRGSSNEIVWPNCELTELTTAESEGGPLQDFLLAAKEESLV